MLRIRTILYNITSCETVIIPFCNQQNKIKTQTNQKTTLVPSLRSDNH